MSNIVELTDLEIAAVSGGQSWWDWIWAEDPPVEEEVAGIKG